MNISSIKILCDQKDCIYNAGSTVHHDHSHDSCMHKHPAIQRYGKFPNFEQNIFCNSKETIRTNSSRINSIEDLDTLIKITLENEDKKIVTESTLNTLVVKLNEVIDELNRINTKELSFKTTELPSHQQDTNPYDVLSRKLKTKRK